MSKSKKMFEFLGVKFSTMLDQAAFFVDMKRENHCFLRQRELLAAKV